MSRKPRPVHAPPSGTVRPSRWPWLLLSALSALAVLLMVQAWRYQPPSALAADTSLRQFSASRALVALREVLGDESPHPAGSAANRQVRDRIVKRLQSLGYAPEIQTGHACDEWGSCATVENIVARLEGRRAGPMIALAAHYDSVAAGPGAADDGIGIAAILEIARLLKAMPRPPGRPVLLLLTDGEETGLLGARVFVEEHPWALQVAQAINLEARGNKGPSFMFETGRDNAAAMALYPSSLERPITNSIYYTAYKLLPNDTDFTVFKAAGWQGYNFALTGNVQHYHTPLDRIAKLSPASLQHHGDNAFSVLQALSASTDDRSKPVHAITSLDEEAVYVDLLATRVLAWPVSMAMPLAVASALLWALLVWIQFRRRQLRLTKILQAVGLAVMALCAAALASQLLLMLLRSLAAIPSVTASYRWTAYPLPLDIATAALSAMTVLLVADRSRSRVCLAAWWTANSLLLLGATLASALWLPGLGFAFQLPLLVLLFGAMPVLVSTRTRVQSWAQAALLSSLLTGVLVLMPTIGFLHMSLGPDALVVAAAVMVWIFLPLIGPLAQAGQAWCRGLLNVASAMAVAAGLASSMLPPYTADSPQRVNLEYLLDADSGLAEWLVKPDSGQLPPSLATTAAFSPRLGPLLPWLTGATWRADAARLDLAAPGLEVISAVAAGAGIRYQIHLQSRRGASSISLCWLMDRAPTAIEVQGTLLPAPDARMLSKFQHRQAGYRCISEHGLSEQGVELRFVMPSRLSFDVLLSDRRAGLPEPGLMLLSARPVDAVPSRDGDGTRVMRRVHVGSD